MGKYDATNISKLKEVCVILNDMTAEREKAGIDKIKTVGIKKDDLVKLFVEAAEKMDAAEITLPDEVVNFFNDGIQEGDAPPAPKKEKAEKAEKKEPAPKKEPAEKKEKTPKADTERSPLGSKEGSQAYAIDFLLLKGTTLKDAAEEVGSTPSRVNSHIKALKEKRGYKIPCKDGVYKVVKE